MKRYLYLYLPIIYAAFQVLLNLVILNYPLAGVPSVSWALQLPPMTKIWTSVAVSYPPTLNPSAILASKKLSVASSCLRT